MDGMAIIGSFHNVGRAVSLEKVVCDTHSQNAYINR